MCLIILIGRESVQQQLPTAARSKVSWATFAVLACLLYIAFKRYQRKQAAVRAVLRAKGQTTFSKALATGNCAFVVDDVPFASQSCRTKSFDFASLHNLMATADPYGQNWDAPDFRVMAHSRLDKPLIENVWSKHGFVNAALSAFQCAFFSSRQVV